MQLKSLATAKMTAKAAAILAAGALTLTACGGSSTPAASEGGIQLINAGKLTVCSDVPYEPFEFQKDGKTVGFDMDIAAEVAKDLNAELSVVDSSFEAIETGTALTQCDVSISSISITDTRKAVMDFSTPYLDDDLALVASDDSGINEPGRRQGQEGGRPAGHHRRRLRQPRRASTPSSSRTPASWSRPCRPAPSTPPWATSPSWATPSRMTPSSRRREVRHR